MKRILVLFAFIISYSGVYAQFNMIGNGFSHIWEFFNEAPEFYVKTDTVNNGNTIVLTCKTSSPYPYYIYEIDVNDNECVSFCTVSKDYETLQTYFDLLSSIGTLESADSSKLNYVYSVLSHSKGQLYYSIMQPYTKSDFVSKRNIFYVVVTKELR